jgi:SAM-dependent methyltransferase
MEMADLVRRARNRVRPPLVLFRFLNSAKPQFECPVCNYKGPFMDLTGFAGVRKHAKCPKCKCLERHRLQYLAVMGLIESMDVSGMKMLHIAPEPCFRQLFSGRFGVYETADLLMKGVDHNVDLQNLPFKDATYDVVFASHVLEHIADDNQAIREIRRILRPGGVAILPVPVVCEKTIEYPQANPAEAYHVRAPGFDYFNKYRQYFSRVEVYTSDSYPEKYQLFVYEDRSAWPTPECPLRPPMHGERHADVVPVCYA